MHNAYEVIPGTIYNIIQESPLIRTLQIRPEIPIEFQTGQFVELSLPGIGEGPFTPSSSHYTSEVMDITIMKTGFVTEYIHKTSIGDIVGIRGPYGSKYPLEK